ncbi:VWA domain-containing protein [Peteryoungia desertarenae]|uniref:VWA domain-containing protein n=1 Tax=Peteryoungia desertarenae TaxID=1813451 RepID=A0ABX6QIZ2_9HYPH|nr:pilus assembly protein [Peteryoungia desertarenae]QLF68526.1 VWA domain-containing protein [Peteryoungia desertarenae]
MKTPRRIRNHRSAASFFLNVFRRGLRCTSGQFGILFAVIAPVSIVAIGGTIDIAMAERVRTDLQKTLDNATLAAASITQNQNAEAVVNEFLRTHFGGGVTASVSMRATADTRVVNSVATYTHKTYFLHLLDMDVLNISVSSTASEYAQNVELSLVLDISGSMLAGETVTRIDALRPAAQRFVEEVLNERTKLTTTINLIPYSGQVALGARAFDTLTGGTSTGVRKHNHSSCIGDRSTRYSSSIPNFRQAEHVPHFATNRWAREFEPWQCPNDESAAILFSNDKKALSERIAEMQLHDGTGTHIGMRWAIMTLDNRFNTHVRQLDRAEAFDIDDRHLNRPLPFNSGSRKVIVLMTDGEVWHQHRPETSDPLGPVRKIVDKSQTQRVLREACSWAKNNKIEIYTIGYEVTDNDANSILKNCASSPSHYYDADIENIDIILSNIAGNISGLKLTQ